MPWRPRLEAQPRCEQCWRDRAESANGQPDETPTMSERKVAAPSGDGPASDQYSN